MNGTLSNVGDPSVYEKAYTSEGMTFRNMRPCILDLSKSEDSSENKSQKENPFGMRKDTDDYEWDNKQIHGLSYPQTEKTNSEINAVNPDEDGASSQEQPNSAFPTHLDQSPANLSSIKPSSEDDSAKTVTQSQPGFSTLNSTILPQNLKVPTPDPPSKGTSTYTLTKNGGVYYLNNEPISLELEDNETTVLVPYNHNNEDNPATHVYLMFTRENNEFTFVKAVIRMPSPLCSIKHPKSYSDACTRGPPDR